MLSIRKTAGALRRIKAAQCASGCHHTAKTRLFSAWFCEGCGQAFHKAGPKYSIGPRGLVPFNPKGN